MFGSLELNSGDNNQPLFLNLGFNLKRCFFEDGKTFEDLSGIKKIFLLDFFTKLQIKIIEIFFSEFFVANSLVNFFLFLSF